MPDADIFTPALNIYKFFKEQGEQKKQRVLEQFFNNPEIATAAYGANAFPGDKSALQRIMGERKAQAEEERQMNIFNSIPFEYRGYVPKNERGELDLTPEGLQQTSKTARFITALKETADKTQKKSEDIRKGNIDFKRDVAMEKIKGGIREAAESAKKLTGYQPVEIGGRPYIAKLDKEGTPQVIQQVSPEKVSMSDIPDIFVPEGFKPSSTSVTTKEGVNYGFKPTEEPKPKTPTEIRLEEKEKERQSKLKNVRKTINYVMPAIDSYYEHRYGKRTLADPPTFIQKNIRDVLVYGNKKKGIPGGMTIEEANAFVREMQQMAKPKKTDKDEPVVPSIKKGSEKKKSAASKKSGGKSTQNLKDAGFE